MKKYYISTQTGLSGICKYSADFYELVLKDKGYKFLDSSSNLAGILSQVTSNDLIHIEIGIFQKNEIKILIALLDANYKNVRITLHDPPLIKYPLREFNNTFVNNVSKFYDIYINNFRDSLKHFERIKSIYVLSRSGVELVKHKYKVDNVLFLPHVINEKEIKRNEGINDNFMYLGFIGKNKNIEYALQVHQRLLTDKPHINFYIIGASAGKSQRYYNSLKEKYKKNVHFMGYTREDRMDDILRNVSFSFIPFKSYKFYCPASGSLLYSLKKGIIPFVNNVNSIGEIIRDGVNGKFLSGEIKRDVKTINKLLDSRKKQEDMKNEIYNYVLRNHNAQAIASRVEA